MRTKTNQPGLKQQGTFGTVGRSGRMIAAIGHRVNPLMRTCGLPNSGLRCMYGVAEAIGQDKPWWTINMKSAPAKNYCKQVINQRDGTVCRWPQPKNRQLAGGVGNIWTPRRDHCTKTCKESKRDIYMSKHGTLPSNTVAI